jgi:hypothetical protein
MVLFKPPSAPINATLTAVAAADVNGDGKTDVVGLFNNNLMVYLSHGDGTFAAGVPYFVGDTSGSNVITPGDFNGDHIADVAVSLGPATAPQEMVSAWQRGWYIPIGNDIDGRRLSQFRSYGRFQR